MKRFALLTTASLAFAMPAVAEEFPMWAIRSIQGFQSDQVLKFSNSTTFFNPRVVLGNASTLALSAVSDSNGTCRAMGFQSGKVGAIHFHPDPDVYAAVFVASGLLERVIMTNTPSSDELVNTITCY